MSVTRVAGTIHKWLALILAVPILFWFGSGLFFAITPIERVRSEHRIANLAAQPVRLDAAAAGLARLAANGVAVGDRIELRTLLSRPVALVARGEGRPQLFDLRTGRLISPISARVAASIAMRDHAGPAKPVRVAAVAANSPEYRGALPVWRVDFEGETTLSLYVAADTGMVTARRSTLWRVYDFLWALHILDFRGHEDFNTPLLILMTFLSLVVLVSGVVMFPERLGWQHRRRRNIGSVDPDGRKGRSEG